MLFWHFYLFTYEKLRLEKDMLHTYKKEFFASANGYTGFKSYFDEIFDMEKKMSQINAMTHDKVQEVIAVMFDEREKALALIGNTDKPLAL